jgi:hypothetical protein
MYWEKSAIVSDVSGEGAEAPTGAVAARYWRLTQKSPLGAASATDTEEPTGDAGYDNCNVAPREELAAVSASTTSREAGYDNCNVAARVELAAVPATTTSAESAGCVEADPDDKLREAYQSCPRRMDK